jgi:deferrochelatase/peroxidase EfeB
MMLVAFDVLASDKADLERLFRLLTRRIAFLTKGGPRRRRRTRVCRRWIPAFSGRGSPRIT